MKKRVDQEWMEVHCKLRSKATRLKQRVSTIIIKPV